MADARLSAEFGEVLRRRRERAGLSQEKLAFRANLHRTYIGLLERGARNPTLATISDLAKALDTTMTSIVREVERRVQR